MGESMTSTINPVQPQEKKSKLSTAMDILGTGLSIAGTAGNIGKNVQSMNQNSKMANYLKYQDRLGNPKLNWDNPLGE